MPDGIARVSVIGTLPTGNGLPYWLDFERPSYPCLEHEVSAEVAVIGAGVAGLKVAEALLRRGSTVVVVDGGGVGEGASSRNQGGIVTGAGPSYATLVTNFGRQTAASHVRLIEYNRALLVDQIERYAIDCNYQVLGEYLLVRRDRPGVAAELNRYREEHALLASDGFRVDLVDESEAYRVTGNRLFAGGMRFPNDAQFHPGRFVAGLGRTVAGFRGSSIFEHSPVRLIAGDPGSVIVQTASGRISCSHVVLAANALAPQLLPALAERLSAERGQVIVTEPLTLRPCVGCFMTQEAWWRDIRETDGKYRLLFGGARGRDQEKLRQFSTDGRRNPALSRHGYRTTIAHARRLQRELHAIFPKLSDVPVTHRWAGLQGFTGDGLPLLGLFDSERGVHGVAGFSGMGNAYSNVAAEWLAGRICGTQAPVEERFGSFIGRMMCVGRPSARIPGKVSVPSE